MNITLKNRIILTFTALGIFISLTLGFIAHQALEYSEEIMVDETIRQQTEVLSDLYLKDIENLPAHTNIYNLFVQKGNDTSHIPDEVLKLEAGAGEVFIDGIEYEVITNSRDDYTLYYLYNLSSFESFEVNMSYILLLGIIFCSALSLWLGRLISGRIIKPVRVLSENIQNHSPESGGISFNYQFANDELGMLANKFIAYDNDFRQFVEREKLFTANVSHELRTPIAVILGASEVLEMKFSADRAESLSIQRIKHETLLLKSITEMMLLLTRNQRDSLDLTQKVELVALTRNITDAITTELTNPSIQIHYSGLDSMPVESSSIALYIILRNLLHNAYSYTSEGVITIDFHQNELTIADTGVGLEAIRRNNTQSMNNDSEAIDLHCGIGLKLTRDLCDICQIEFKLEQREDTHGSIATLIFP